MHELSIADGIVEHCADRANGARVLRVRLEIGVLSCVTADALRFCFDVCAKDTMLEGAGDLRLRQQQPANRCGR
jgi:hydrogenase nickel incorporation protein HypA/HybF